MMRCKVARSKTSKYELNSVVLIIKTASTISIDSVKCHNVRGMIGAMIMMIMISLLRYMTNCLSHPHH